MAKLALSPILDSGVSDRSVIIGAPENFDFLTSLAHADDVRVAVAFGHKSGWLQVEHALKHSTASRIEVLLGQAFYQTEPELILLLRELQQQGAAPVFEVRLASAVSTFHPKVWIVEGPSRSFGIVGSGNLSHGGLLSNVECSLYTSRSEDVTALKHWFQFQWAAAPEFAKTYQAYISEYQVLRLQRKTIEEKIETATRAQADREVTWQRRRAIKLSAAYFKSPHGRAEVEARIAAIQKMRQLLHYPDFTFNAGEWQDFLRIPELGRIRLGHEQKIISSLPALIIILKKLPQFKSVGAAVEALQRQQGIGRNLATKLLAVYDPDKNVVVNEPVQSALRALQYDSELDSELTGQAYEKFLKDLAPFIEECESARFPPGPALDAFFYDYRNGSAEVHLDETKE
jgi:HKD family nuclease